MSFRGVHSACLRCFSRRRRSRSGLVTQRKNAVQTITFTAAAMDNMVISLMVLLFEYFPDPFFYFFAVPPCLVQDAGTTDNGDGVHGEVLPPLRNGLRCRQGYGLQDQQHDHDAGGTRCLPCDGLGSLYAHDVALLYPSS